MFKKIKNLLKRGFSAIEGKHIRKAAQIVLTMVVLGFALKIAWDYRGEFLDVKKVNRDSFIKAILSSDYLLRLIHYDGFIFLLIVLFFLPSLLFVKWEQLKLGTFEFKKQVEQIKEKAESVETKNSKLNVGRIEFLEYLTYMEGTHATDIYPLCKHHFGLPNYSYTTLYNTIQKEYCDLLRDKEIVQDIEYGIIDIQTINAGSIHRDLHRFVSQVQKSNGNVNAKSFIKTTAKCSMVIYFINNNTLAYIMSKDIEFDNSDEFIFTGINNTIVNCANKYVS